ncbi:MAG: MerR family transcriptional regulator [Chloroflexota bacterium]
MFRIGEFAKFSRISIKMLRHYDEIGLFKPAWIDPESNYRYYAASQLHRLNRIVALKDLGFSLEQIHQLLVDEFSAEQFRGLLKLRQLELEKQLDETAVQLLQVKNQLAQLDAPLSNFSEVVVRRIESERYASLRENVNNNSNAIPHLFDEVEKAVGRQKARAAKPPLLVYHGEGELEPFDIEILVPILGEFAENGRVSEKVTHSIEQMACLVHTGPYHSLSQTYLILAQWIEEHQYKIVGPIRELFLRFSGSEDGYQLPKAFIAENAEQFVTELQIPIHKK